MAILLVRVRDALETTFLLCGSGRRTDDELNQSRANANVARIIVLLHFGAESKLSESECLERHLKVDHFVRPGRFDINASFTFR